MFEWPGTVCPNLSSESTHLKPGLTQPSAGARKPLMFAWPDTMCQNAQAKNPPVETSISLVVGTLLEVINLSITKLPGKVAEIAKTFLP